MNPAERARWTYLRFYVAAGWRIVPNYAAHAGGCTCPAGPTCPHPGKHPRIKDWPQAATGRLATIRGWLRRWPDFHPGIVTGQGLLALDVDARHGGVRWLLAHRFGLPPTVQQRTAGGGLHLLYIVPAGYHIQTTNQGQLAPGVDTRGDGGQIIVAPARNRHGPYAWLPGHAPWEHPIAPAPDDLLALLLRYGILRTPPPRRPPVPPPPLPASLPRPSAGVILDRYLARAQPGCRNIQGFHLALQLRDNGYTPDEAAAYLREYQRQVDDPADHYTWAEAVASLHQAYRHAPRRPWAVPRHLSGLPPR